MSGCNGQCCAAFELPFSLDVLKAGIHPDSKLPLRDGAQIADMVIPLTHEEADARLDAVGSPRVGSIAEGAQVFTCRHWDAETKLCGIYADRPVMCRDYPYGRPCEHGCGCTDGA